MRKNEMYLGGDGKEYYVGPNKIVSALIALSVIIVTVVMLTIASYQDTHYHTTAKVYQQDSAETLFVDGTGNVWAVNNTEKYKVGEFVELYFDNNRTDYTRNDDIIIKIKKLDI